MPQPYRRSSIGWRLVPWCVALLGLGGPVGAGSLDDLQWMIGSWKRESRSGAVVREVWTRLGERVFEGHGSRQSGEPASPTVPLEDLLLVEMGGEVFYVAKVSENPYPVPFRLVSLEGRSAVFENPDHDFPQRITYALQDDGTLFATAEGPPDEGGSPHRLEYRFARE